MLKRNPFLLASIIFAGLSLLLLVVATVSVVIKDDTVCSALISLFHLQEKSITNSTLAQFSVILAVPSFIFAYKA